MNSFFVEDINDLLLMYCSNCGKELPNDSNFCPNCGKKQNESGDIVNVFSRIKDIYNRKKTICSMYGIWVIIHLSLLLFSNPRGIGNKYGGGHYSYDVSNGFYPFDESFTGIINGKDYMFSFFDNVNVYDISEFFFYTVVMPLLIYCFFSFFPSIKTFLTNKIQFTKTKIEIPFWKALLFIYSIWFVIHLFILLLSPKTNWNLPEESFYPFNVSIGDIIQGHPFRIYIDITEGYDSSEFVFYTIVLPLFLLFVYITIFQILRRSKIKETKSSTETSCQDGNTNVSHPIKTKYNSEHPIITWVRVKLIIKSILKDFITSIHNCYDKIFNMDGCSSRKEYLYWQLYVFFVISLWIFLLQLIKIAYYNLIINESISYIFLILLILIIIPVIIIPNWNATIRRLHDSNHSGWHMLWALIPCFIGEIILVIILLLPSSPSSRWRNY